MCFMTYTRGKTQCICLTKNGRCPFSRIARFLTGHAPSVPVSRSIVTPPTLPRRAPPPRALPLLIGFLSCQSRLILKLSQFQVCVRLTQDWERLTGVTCVYQELFSLRRYLGVRECVGFSSRSDVHFLSLKEPSTAVGWEETRDEISARSVNTDPAS